MLDSETEVLLSFLGEGIIVVTELNHILNNETSTFWPFTIKDLF